MYLYNLDVVSDQSLPPVDLCNVLETKYHAEIKKSCTRIKEYLQQNEEIPGVKGSISDLVHYIFYKLDDEIKNFLLKEKTYIFPKMLSAFKEGEIGIEQREIEEIKETHLLILNIVQRLRGLLCNYILKEEWSREFKECVSEFYRLENKILKWVHLKENCLFVKVTNSEITEPYSATVSLL